MAVYKFFFTIFFLWCSVFTISLCVYHFKKRQFFPAINAAILQIAATVLCVLYLI